jgi:hypothetical protein
MLGLSASFLNPRLLQFEKNFTVVIDKLPASFTGKLPRLLNPYNVWD